MARPGRKPSPLRLHVLNGKWDSRRMMPEPSAEPGPVVPPDDLDPEARTVWERLAPELEQKGLLAPRYADLFRVLCETVATNRRASRLLMKSAPVLRHGERVVSNPTWLAYRQSAELLARLSADFGLTPAGVTAIARDAGRALHGQTPNDPRRLLSG